MKSFEQYMDEYAVSHRNPINIKIHQVCVPLILWSIFGFLYEWNLASILGGALIFFYLFSKDIKLIVATTMMIILMLAVLPFIEHLRYVSLFVFVAAWIGQFIGHKIEGKKPSFFQDIFFLVIGPIWVVKKIIA